MKSILVYGMTDTHGGIESYIMNVYRHLDKSKIIFDFVCVFDKMVFEDEVKASGSRVFYIPTKSKHPIKHLLCFKKLLKQHPEYDTIYFNILNAGAAYSMAIPWRLNRKIIVHSHNSLDDNMRLHKTFQSRLLKYADVKLACSLEAAKYMFGDNNISDCILIHNAIEINKFTFDRVKRNKVRARFSFKEDEPVVLHVGRITKQKNPMFLIKIVEALHKMTPDIKLLYAGVGPMEYEVKQVVKEMHLEDSVIFLGERKDIPDLMQAADAFLFPSMYEGLPIVAIEAQVASLPLILSDTIPHEVKITDDVTFLSLETSPETWAKTVCNSIDPSKRRDLSAEIERHEYDIGHEIEKIQRILVGE